MICAGQSTKLFVSGLTLLGAFLSLVLPTNGFPDDSSNEYFLPIDVREYEASFGIQRRAEDIADMRPNPQAELIYGRAGKNQQLLLAHMKLNASDGLDIVLMERFEHLTKSVDCHGQDGILSLTFKSKVAFKRALQAWSFVNEAEEIKFLLITNHDDCSPSDQRRPYIVTNIREDAATLTTFLAAQEAPWADVARTFEMDFGKAVLPKKPLGRRLLRPRLDQQINNAFEVSTGQPGTTFNILPGGQSKNDRVDCVDCYMKGVFQVLGHVKVNNVILEALDLSVLPQNLAAEMSLEVTIDDQSPVRSLSNEKTIADLPIPGAAVVIKDVFSLGLRAQFAAGFTTKLKSGITFRAGLSASLPGTPRINLDAVQLWRNSVEGFEAFTVDPIVELKSLSKTADISLAAKPKLVFGIDVIGKINFEIALVINLPELKGTCTAKYKPKGLCPNDPAGFTTGVEFAAKLDLELDLQIDRIVGGSKGDKPFWQQKLWNADANFVNLCFPIDIPAIRPSNSKLVASADLSLPGSEFSDSDLTDPNTGSDLATNTDTFSTGTDSTTPAEPESSSPWTDIFAPVPDSTASTYETPASDRESTSTSPSLASSFSVDGSESLDELSVSSEYTPFPEFTSFPPETSPGPDSAIAFADSNSSPESTSPPENLFSFDSEADLSASDTSLPERNSLPETSQVPELGEGSNFISTDYIPSDESTLAFLSREDTNPVQDRSSFAPDANDVLPEDETLSPEVPELGEGSNFIPTEEPAPSNEYDYDASQFAAGGGEGGGEGGVDDGNTGVDEYVV